MNQDLPTIQKIMTRLEILDVHNAQINSDILKMGQKFDQYAASIQDLTLCVTRMTTLHDQKIQQVENDVNSVVSNCVDKHKGVDLGLRELSQRAHDNANEIRHIKDMVADIHKSLNSIGKILGVLQERLQKNDRFGYMIVGGAVVAGFLINQLLPIIERMF